ncbi:MAG: NapC/NirT family cytochrome c [Deltaproteobacteria bacterium]|nr:NapC/NirT family cytochrome c [Deltaproteobacteria bacterium]
MWHTRLWAAIQSALRTSILWGKMRYAQRTWLRTTRSRIIAGSILCLILLLGAGARYAESPAFCKSCHIMDPYYNAWATSKHNFVPCVHCHYPPESFKSHLWRKFQALSQVAKYVTRTYSSKPFAEIEDAACLRSGCHSTRLLEGRVKTASGIKFDHRPHLTTEKRGRRLKCVSCHSQIVVGNHVEVTYGTCYLCHFRGRGTERTLDPIGGCLGCHTLPEREITVGNMRYNHQTFVTERGVTCESCHLDVLKGSGEAHIERCFTCHNQPEKIALFTDIPLLHEKHVTEHNVACFHCHEQMEHGLGYRQEKVLGPIGEAAAGKGPTEATPPASHLPTLTFNCNFCHQGKHAGQLEMYTGKVAELGLPEIPSPMYLANVDCVGCHYVKQEHAGAQFEGRTYTASPQACVKCHGESFRGIFDDTRNAVQKTLGAMTQKLHASTAAVPHSTPRSEKELWAEEQLQQVESWVNFVQYAHGEHNIYLAAATLRKANALLDEVGKELGRPATDLRTLPLLSEAFCTTLCHKRVGVTIPAETVEHDGKTMPHAMHASLMPCSDCHEFGPHKEGPLRDGAQELCKGCHGEE